MMYLDGMLKSRLEKIHSAVRKIDLCFQYSIKLAVGNGKGKSEEELRAEMMARSPLKNVVMAERLARNTLHGFDILKASLSIIADICSDVRLMYRGIKRDHTLKQERSEKRNSDFAMNNTAEGARSRTPSPARQSRPKTPQSANGGAGAGGSRPHSAPSSSASPVRKKKIKKRAVQSAHESRRGHQHQRQNNNRTVSPQGSRVSYSGDFEEGSAEIPDDTSTYGKGSRDGDDDDGDGDGISDVMKEVLDEASSRRVSATSNSLRQGSGSIVEDILEVAADGDADGVEIDMDLPVQRPYSSKGGPGSRGGGNSRGASNNYNHNYSSNNNRNRSAEATAEEEVDSEAEEFPGEASYEVNVGNMYEDDFDQDSAVLLSNAFQGGDQQATVKSESAKSTQQKRKKRSKKISKLIHSDNLLQPLARMKLTQRNQQSVLHGLLLSNNIPLHYSEEEHVMGAGTGKKPPHIVVTDSWDRPIPINIPTKTAKLASGAKQFKSSGGVGRKSAAATSLPVGILKNSSNVAAGSKLLQSTSTAVASSDNSGVLLKCHQCRRKVSSSLAKHLPVQNATSDARVLERAKAHQKETGQLFPTFERMHVASSTGAQHEWFRQQQELQQNLLHGQGSGHGLKDSTLPGKGQGSDAGQVASVRRGSVSMQKYDYPFCSWECVKGFALSTCTLQQKYEMDILIDIAAGYTVHQPQAAAAEK